MSKTHTGHTIHQVAIGTTALAVSLLFPEFVENIRYWLLGIVILVIGMPHGALDHIITYRSFPKQDQRTTNLAFYGYYLLVMTLYGILWLWLPLAGFLLFLAITIYHFGQADAERFDFSAPAKYFLTIARGLSIVGLIIYGSKPYYISDIVEVITGYNFMQLIAFIEPYIIVPAVLASIYPLVYFLMIGFFVRKRPPLIYHLDAVVVPALFALADPIIAFSVYFGAWHSYNHAQTMLAYLRQKQQQVSMKWFYQQTLLLSILSYLGLAALYIINEAFGNENLLVALLFILISLLTLPHIFIVEMMYRKFDD